MSVMNKEVQQEIISFIQSEASRVGFGKLLIEINITNHKPTNIQTETRRSKNINYVQQD